jgi:hypothetical protein
MGKRKTCRPQPLFLAATDLPRTPAHPFYKRLNEILAQDRFDPFVEEFASRSTLRFSDGPGKFNVANALPFLQGLRRTAPPVLPDFLSAVLHVHLSASTWTPRK